MTVRRVLFQREEFTRDPTLLRKVCIAVREGVTVENCCDLFTAVNRLSGDPNELDVITEDQANQEEVEVNKDTEHYKPAFNYNSDHLVNESFIFIEPNEMAVIYPHRTMNS